MDKLLNIAKYILFLFLAYIIIVGLKETFKPEKKVYREYGRDVYHQTPYCDEIPDIGDIDREYMDETGKIVGTEKIKSSDAYYNFDLAMCDYCYSKLEIDKREEHLKCKKKPKRIEEIRENELIPSTVDVDMVQTNRKWLYIQLIKNGYDFCKNYEEFDSLITNNSDSRKWVYETLVKHGNNIGDDFAEFEKIILKRTYKLNGDIYDIPANLSNGFEKENPKAVLLD